MLNYKSGHDSSMLHSFHNVMELIYMLILKVIFPFQCVLLKAATLQKDVCFNTIINQYNSSSIMSFVLRVTQHCTSLISVRYIKEINMWIWNYSSGDLYKNLKLGGVFQGRELVLNSLTRSIQWTKDLRRSRLTVYYEVSVETYAFWVHYGNSFLY